MATRIVAILCIGMLMHGCGGEYSDVVAVNDAFAEHVQVCSEAITEAEDAADVAGALNALADELEKLAPEMRHLSEKYPELRGSQMEAHPVLARSQKQVEGVSKAFFASMLKAMEYRDDEVRRAQERVSRAMMIGKES